MNNRFVNIQEWMLDLDIKGNELIIFALIFGFSQDEESEFHGSLEYLAHWTNSTKQGVIKSLKSLINKGLIEKRKVFNKVYYSTKFNTDETKFNDGVNKVESEGKQSLHNNIYNNNLNNNINIYKASEKKSKKQKIFIPPTLEEIKKYISEKNYSVDADYFYTYYNDFEWKNKKGDPVKDWKRTLLTWNRNQKTFQKPFQNTFHFDAYHTGDEEEVAQKILKQQEEIKDIDYSNVPF